jgi:hypothetical protein
MRGRSLDKLQRVPIPVLEHLSTQIGGSPPEIATLRAIYGQRRQTLYDHRQFALDTLGMTRFDLTAGSLSITVSARGRGRVADSWRVSVP